MLQELERFDAVKQKFQVHFVHTKNVVYESARFNQRKQETGKTVDEFVTTLNELVSCCKFKERVHGSRQDCSWLPG